MAVERLEHVAIVVDDLAARRGVLRRVWLDGVRIIAMYEGTPTAPDGSGGEHAGSARWA